MSASPSGASSSSAPRTSQRVSKSCSRCTKRKLKCDKQVPCSRCIKDKVGESCTRAEVIVKGQLVGGRDNPAAPQDRQALLQENSALKRRIEALERLHAFGRRASTANDQHQARATRSESPSADARLYAHDLSAVGVAAPSPEERPAKRPRLMWHPSSGKRPPGLSSREASELDLKLKRLVPVVASRSLVTASLRVVGWIHLAVHTDSYLHEHDAWLEGLQDSSNDYAFMAVYFGLLSTGAYFLGDVWLADNGVEPVFEGEPISQAWFQASLDSLYLSDFLRTPRLETLQTICILTLCAHAFAQSTHLLALAHVGLYVGQALGLHRLAAEPVDSTPPPGLIKREVGRSLWSALIVQEGTSPAAQQPHALFHTDPGVCAPQANCDDSEIQEGRRLLSHPPHVQTRVTNRIVHLRLARISRDFSLSFWSADDVMEQYALVQEADRTVTRVLDDMPQLRASSEPYPSTLDVHSPSRIDNTAWVRHHVTLAIARYRIFFHRTFLGRASKDGRFAGSRLVCRGAARDILKERKKAVPAIFDRAWHVTNDTVLAGTILLVLARDERDAAEREALRQDAIALIEVLHKGGGHNNALVRRGVQLLSALLLEDSGAPQQQHQHQQPAEHTTSTQVPLQHQLGATLGHHAAPPSPLQSKLNEAMPPSAWPPHNLASSSSVAAGNATAASLGWPASCADMAATAPPGDPLSWSAEGLSEPFGTINSSWLADANATNVNANDADDAQALWSLFPDAAGALPPNFSMSAGELEGVLFPLLGAGTGAGVGAGYDESQGAVGLPQHSWQALG